MAIAQPYNPNPSGFGISDGTGGQTLAPGFVGGQLGSNGGVTPGTLQGATQAPSVAPTPTAAPPTLGVTPTGGTPPIYDAPNAPVTPTPTIPPIGNGFGNGQPLPTAPATPVPPASLPTTKLGNLNPETFFHPPGNGGGIGHIFGMPQGNGGQTGQPGQIAWRPQNYLPLAPGGNGQTAQPGAQPPGLPAPQPVAQPVNTGPALFLPAGAPPGTVPTGQNGAPYLGG